MTVYYLVLALYAIHVGNGSVSLTTIPEPYQTLEACEFAAKKSQLDFSGRGLFHWVCVEVERD